MSETKQALRKRYKNLRQSMSLSQQHQAMAGLLQQAEMLLSLHPQHVFSFRSSPEKGEVPTELLVEWWQEAGHPFSISLPRVEGDRMVAVFVSEESEFAVSRFGIEEPIGGQIVDPQTIDLVLVPLLAFDERGYRVGYGKGFYDAYLQQCRPDVFRVGLSWFGAEPHIADIAPYDIPLTHCITPNQVYVF